MSYVIDDTIIFEKARELPDFTASGDIYLDFETMSGLPKEMADRPYHGHQIAGAAVAVPEWDNAWYIDFRKLGVENCRAWLKDQLKPGMRWINQNVKFDAHFAAEAGVDLSQVDLVDIMTGAKLIDSDRQFRGGYGLDALAKDFLGKDISQWEVALKNHLTALKSKDYGDVPTEIIGPYAGCDVITAKALHQYIEKMMPTECRRVWNNEQLLTSALFDIERVGMRVDPFGLRVRQVQLMNTLAVWEERLDELAGFPFRAHTSDDCYKVFVTTYGLPVTGYTEAGNPSMDFDAITAYLSMPIVTNNPKLLELVQLTLKFKDKYTLLKMFVEPYLELQVEGVLHPSYNQCVVTGRMACKQPNMQQLSKEAKELIVPGPGKGFLSGDWSQIEFRIIANYINSDKCIQAYAENPDTDFHQWVADMCGIDRSPAKGVNFSMGYGAGKSKVEEQLVANRKIIDWAIEYVTNVLKIPADQYSPQFNEAFKRTVQTRASEVYGLYHQALPNLKSTMKQAENALKSRVQSMGRGYVRNMFGRHRHLDVKFAWKGFNSLCQSSAADWMKECAVVLSPRYNSDIKRLGLDIVALVHDEIVFWGDKEATRDPAIIKYIADIMEEPRGTVPEMKIPMRSSMGISTKNWREASTTTLERTYWET